MNQNLLNSVKMSVPKRTRFDLSHDVKTTMRFGELVPTLVMDVVPGDTVEIGHEALVRFAPLVSPVMHRINCYAHTFFVPNRILWEGWQDWIRGKENPPAFPTMEIRLSTEPTHAWKNPRVNKLLNHMGLPKNVPAGGDGHIQHINALPFAALQCIYNEYYRDQNLIEEVDYKLVNGDNTSNEHLYTLRYRAWEHDYFTSGLPFPQKGASVEIPLGDVILKDPWIDGGSNIPTFKKADGTLASTGDLHQNTGSFGMVETVNGEGPVAYDPDGTLTVQSTSIIELRRAFRLQEYLERIAVAGNRYYEWVRAIFGVTPSDARLQRPEYITGMKAPVNVSEVLNTSGGQIENRVMVGRPQGDMAGHAVSLMGGRSGRFNVEEHGYIITVMSVMPLPSYYQGIPKHFLKTTDQFEYFTPQFEQIGEQPVKYDEIYAYTLNTGQETFNYQPRYAEYKFMSNRVAGNFDGNLEFWHLGRKFSDIPHYNAEFIELMDDTALTRIFAVQPAAGDFDTDYIWMTVLHNISAIRPMSMYSTPTM